jgi:dCTP deaminase
MSILRGTEISKEIEAGNIIIDPYFPNNVQPASLDLTLSSQCGFLRRLERHLSTSRFGSGQEAIVWKTVGNKIVIPPGKTRVGKAMEKVSLPDDILGMILPKGRLNLCGLALQVSAGLVQPGRKDQELFFLITNVGLTPVDLLTDDRICQLVLFRL